MVIVLELGWRLRFWFLALPLPRWVTLALPPLTLICEIRVMN